MFCHSLLLSLSILFSFLTTGNAFCTERCLLFSFNNWYWRRFLSEHVGLPHSFNGTLRAGEPKPRACLVAGEVKDKQPLSNADSVWLTHTAKGGVAEHWSCSHPCPTHKKTKPEENGPGGHHASCGSLCSGQLIQQLSSARRCSSSLRRQEMRNCNGSVTRGRGTAEMEWSPFCRPLLTRVSGDPWGVLPGPDQLQARLWLHGFVDSAGHSAFWRVCFPMHLPYSFIYPLWGNVWGISNFCYW